MLLGIYEHKKGYLSIAFWVLPVQLYGALQTQKIFGVVLLTRKKLQVNCSCEVNYDGPGGTGCSVPGSLFTRFSCNA